MKKLLVINDNSPAANHALRFALKIAEIFGSTVTVANTVKTHVKQHSIPLVAVGRAHNTLPYKDSFVKLKSTPVKTKVPVSYLDISDLGAEQVIELINRCQISLIIKGMDHLAVQRSTNINGILNRVRCPLMLIPLGWQLKVFKRLTYLADLRYCRVEIIKFLFELAKPFHANLCIANVPAKGLPYMDDAYAKSVFDEKVRFVDYDAIQLNHIRERDLQKIMDVMVNGLDNDLFAVVNHRFHFEQIMGRRITNVLPAGITIPLLIFPY
nr:universal stress protein [uncultured Mucilaginibacter sp.]